MSGEPRRVRGENLRELMFAIRDGKRADWRRKPRPERQGPSKVGVCRWRGRLEIPQHAHPLVRRLWHELNKQQTTIAELADRCAVHRATMRQWGRKNHPRIDHLEAALNALGLGLKVVELEE